MIKFCIVGFFPQFSIESQYYIKGKTRKLEKKGKKKQHKKQ